MCQPNVLQVSVYELSQVLQSTEPAGEISCQKGDFIPKCSPDIWGRLLFGTSHGELDSAALWRLHCLPEGYRPLFIWGLNLFHWRRTLFGVEGWNSALFSHAEGPFTPSRSGSKSEKKNQRKSEKTSKNKRQTSEKIFAFAFAWSECNSTH